MQPWKMCPLQPTSKKLPSETSISKFCPQNENLHCPGIFFNQMYPIKYFHQSRLLKYGTTQPHPWQFSNLPRPLLNLLPKQFLDHREKKLQSQQILTTQVNLWATCNHFRFTRLRPPCLGLSNQAHRWRNFSLKLTL